VESLPLEAPEDGWRRERAWRSRAGWRPIQGPLLVRIDFL